MISNKKCRQKEAVLVNSWEIGMKVMIVNYYYDYLDQTKGYQLGTMVISNWLLGSLVISD